ncbi:unnamed protein product [Cylicostephanus goldi]|uniref:SXP/RAL-2 family protein Ani s 5-like cation-binding domain-containing protein n=1 Tax=Cylicostephanus goldi TaxID=71465 RepID=A0A3P6QSX3_CYLGO|nr:unnamed protein product [Cylicostephanus goldi]
MNTILVFVALLGFALCDIPLPPQPPEALPEAELEQKREEIKKELREKMVNLIHELDEALNKQTKILDDKSLSRKDKLNALRKLREENPKVYNVLKAILHQFVPKHKFGRRHGPMMMKGPRHGWQKGPKEGNKPFGPMKLPEPMKPMQPKLEVPVKA